MTVVQWMLIGLAGIACVIALCSIVRGRGAIRNRSKIRIIGVIEEGDVNMQISGALKQKKEKIYEITDIKRRGAACELKSGETQISIISMRDFEDMYKASIPEFITALIMESTSTRGDSYYFSLDRSLVRDKYEEFTGTRSKESGNSEEEYEKRCEALRKSIEEQWKRDQNKQAVVIANTYCEAAKTYYQELTERQAAFKEATDTSLSFFKAMIDDLGCYAGCSKPERVDGLVAHMANAQGHIRFLLNKKYASCHDALKLRCDTPYSSDMETRETVYRNQLLSESKALQEALEEKLRQLDNELKALPSYKDRYVYLKGKKQEIRESSIAKEDIETLSKKGDAYLSDAKRLKNELLGSETLWMYHELLQYLMPVVEEIAALSDDGKDVLTVLTEETSTALCRKLYDALEECNRNHPGGYHFRWLEPTDGMIQQSLRIANEFNALDVRYPGLYLYADGKQNDAEALICVAPGAAISID